MSAAETTRAVRIGRGLTPPLVLLCLWWLAFALHLADERVSASIGSVLYYLLHLVISGELWVDIAASVGRNLLGFGVGAALGVVNGIAFGLSPSLREPLLPSIHVLKQVSVFAWLPLISIWFGLGEGARVFVIALGTWLPVLLNTLEGVSGVPQEFLDVARVYRFSRWQAVYRIILPAALPSIFTGLYVGLVMSWMATLGAEYMLTATNGVGHLLLDGRENFRMDQLIVGVVVIGLIGFLLHLVAGAIEHRVLGWRGRSLAGRI